MEKHIDIPKEAKEIIIYHIELINKMVPNILSHYYIYGSISLCSFNKESSDIDFIAILNRNLNIQEIGLLKEMHRKIRKDYPSIDIEGRYILEIDMKNNSNIISSLRFLEGEYLGNENFDKNSIDAFQLKKYGIVVKGNKKETLNYIVNFDILLKNMIDNLNSYWLEWKNNSSKLLSPKGIAILFNLEAVEWGVLGVTRLYYTFMEKDIISKVGAGEYALGKVPEKYHNIINEAMRIRKKEKKSYYKSIFKRRKDAIDYMSFIIKESNRMFNR